MDTAQWPQEIGLVKPMEGMVSSSSNNNTCSRPMVERKARPQKEQALNCPRCNSTNTKFCYYNNYSLTQPRYFCKTCRRYWTEGGSLRNVPVGGGSRKNKRSSSSAASAMTTSSSAAAKKLSDQHQPQSQNPKIHQGHDLNLGFPITEPYSTLSEFLEPSNTNNNTDNSNNNNHHNRNPSSTTSPLSALELLRTGITSRGLNSFMPMPIPDSNATYSSGFSLQDFKPPLNFGVDGLGSNTGYGSLQGAVQESTGRLLFPFEDLRQVSSTTEFDQNRGHGGDSTGYWSGMLGGGSW